MSSRPYLIVSGVIFGLVAVMHLVRSINAWVFQIGPYTLLPWMSYFGFAFAAALSIWALLLARK